MKELKEEIIEALQDATDTVDGTVSIPILDHFLDGILNEQCNRADVIRRLLAMKNGKDLPEFDHNKANDKTYCIEWGIKKGKWITDGIIDRYIEELNCL